jgi:hypothetical protein
LEEGATLPRARGLPRLSHSEMEETKKLIADFLRKGWIEPSMAGYGAPLFFVPKANGKGLRAVADYRQINKITKKILPSLPLMENIITELAGSQYLSGLDLTSQFYQIRVEPEDVPLTAIRTIYGMYQFKVCPMGQTGSVGTAMSVMESILSHVISYPGEKLPENPRTLPPLPKQPDFSEDEAWQLRKYHSALGSYCCVFIDDILVHSRTEEEHIRHLRQVCATLVQHKLYLNLDKCELMRPQIIYLGNIMGRYGIHPTKERTQALRKWPTPQDVGEVRSFLGLCGFIRRWIPDFAHIAAPLHQLLKKGVPWSWTSEHDAAFEELKILCATPPVLAIPGRDDDLVVRCDASREAMGIALYRKDARGFLQPVEYKSKSFADAQKKLPAHDRECLALLYALKSFRHYLLHKHFQVQTDNAALSQIMTSRDMSDLYARWYSKLTEFAGMQIIHRPGSKMYCADALSRRRSSEEEQDSAPFEVEPGELAKIVVKQARVSLHHNPSDGFFVKVSRATTSPQDARQAEPSPTALDARLHDEHVCGASAAFELPQLEPIEIEDYRKEWPKLYEKDPELADIWQQKGDIKWGFYVWGGLLWKEGPANARLCVPHGADKVKILRHMHDANTAGHPGKHRTLAKVLGNYYWSGVYGDTVRYVASCHKCQLAKIDRHTRAGAAQAIPLPSEPWQAVHMDWMSGFTKSTEGYDTILVFVCALTGMVHLQPCKKTDTAKDTAQHFLRNVVRLHGFPTAIHSDRDVRLQHFWKSLQDRLGTQLRYTTRHHPQTNGKVERVNATLADVLRSLCNWAGSDWVQHLDMAEFCINSSTSSATGMTPFFANLAREPRTPATAAHPRLDVPAAAEMADAIFASLAHTRDAMERAKRKWEKDNVPTRKVRIFEPGDKVVLSTANLELKFQARKLTSKFVGPFEILPPPSHSTNPNVVWLNMPRALRIHMPVNVKEIKHYITRTEDLGGSADEPPEPILVDGALKYEVEEVLAIKTVRRQRKALVKWLGFSVLDASFEPIENIPSDFIESFYRMQQDYHE